MNPKAKIILRELSKYKNPVVLETGCTRHTVLSKALPDGASTYYIAKWIKENGGEFYSIDKQNTYKAKQLLDKNGLECNFIAGDSLEEIKKLKGKRFDLVLLDSANDPELILKEFIAISQRMKNDFTVIVDDVNVKSSIKKKGDKLIPFLEKHGISYKVENQMCII